MMKLQCGARIGATAAALMMLAGAAYAGSGQPSPQQIGLQEPATEMMRTIVSFHNATTWLLVAITAFVLGLMLYVAVRFNEKANPVPSNFTHNATVEVLWTVIPVIVLLVIAVPSFRLLFAQYTYPKPDVTIKAIGNTWMWVHEYPDLGIKVDSNMITDEDVVREALGNDKYKEKFGKITDDLALAKALYAESKPLWEKRGEPRQLAVDNEIAVPVGKVVHVLVTSAADGVIHSWTIPSFGSRTQAVPGRITSTWFRADKEGIYYGQCSVLCGKLHSSMPIAIRVVKQEAFDQWTAAVKAKDSKKAKAILKATAEDTGAPKFAAVAN